VRNIVLPSRHARLHSSRGPSTHLPLRALWGDDPSSNSPAPSRLLRALRVHDGHRSDEIYTCYPLGAPRHGVPRRDPSCSHRLPPLLPPCRNRKRRASEGTKEVVPNATLCVIIVFMDCHRCGVRFVPYCADCSLMTVRQVMERLHCSRDTVSRWLNSGKLTPLRIAHRRVFVRRAEVERLLGK
jgi:excisionase family DNA binding protein